MKLTFYLTVYSGLLIMLSGVVTYIFVHTPYNTYVEYPETDAGYYVLVCGKYRNINAMDCETVEDFDNQLITAYDAGGYQL